MVKQYTHGIPKAAATGNGACPASLAAVRQRLMGDW
jgi:hypothetical protein